MRLFRYLLLIVCGGFSSGALAQAAPVEVANVHAYIDSTYAAPEYKAYMPSGRVWLEIPYFYQIEDEFNPRGGVERVSLPNLYLETSTGKIFWQTVECARVRQNQIVPTGNCRFTSEVREVMFDDGMSVRPRLRLFIYLDLS